MGAFFAQALGITQFASSATGRAEYYLPVPMGSPENYYGVFGLTRGLATARTVTSTNTTSAGGDSGLRVPTTAPTGTWTATSGTKQAAVSTDNTTYVQTSTNAGRPAVRDLRRSHCRPRPRTSRCRSWA